MVKDSHSNNGARTVYMGEKMHLDPYPMLYIKIKSNSSVLIPRKVLLYP